MSLAEGCVDVAAVGNEVMYRGDLTEDELLGIWPKSVVCPTMFLWLCRRLLRVRGSSADYRRLRRIAD